MAGHTHKLAPGEKQLSCCDLLVESARREGELQQLLATIYLNYHGDGDVRASSMCREIEAMAERRGGDFLYRINMYKD